jgi:uncharacterized protein GlcG (DUF336 family)
MLLRLLCPLLVALLALGFPQGSSAITHALLQSPRLSIDLASGMASIALTRCEQRGAAVSVTVVDPQGQVQVFLQGDGAAPHTRELSRHKAYTAVSLAALQGFHTTSQLADAMRQTKASIGLLPLPADSVEGITPIPGGVILRSDQLLIGGIGVSGARQGQMDEQCALDAEAWLMDQFTATKEPAV